MDFYEVLNQIHDLLRSRGRVAFRALQRQFDLADEDIEALKDELIYAQQVAADEDNRIFVWAGYNAQAPLPPSFSPTQDP